MSKEELFIGKSIPCCGFRSNATTPDTYTPIIQIRGNMTVTMRDSKGLEEHDSWWTLARRIQGTTDSKQETRSHPFLARECHHSSHEKHVRYRINAV